MIKKIDCNTCFSFENNEGVLLTYTPSFNEDERKNIRLKQAIIKLKFNYTGGDNKFDVNYVDSAGNSYIIDTFKNAGNNGYICFDITDELQDELDNNSSEIKFRIVNASTSMLEEDNTAIIEYVLKKEVMFKSKNYEISAKKAGNVYVDLLNGIMMTDHSDLVSNSLCLPLNINHTYNYLNSSKNSFLEYKVGKDWKLNLHKYLIKKSCENLSDDGSCIKYTYVDEAGREINFNEKYYYMDNNVKKYLLPSQINIDMDKNLSYLKDDITYEVKKEIESESGFLLQTELPNFKGISYVEKDIQEVATLKNEITNINDELVSLTNSISLITDERSVASKYYSLQNKSLSTQNYSYGVEENSINMQRSINNLKSEYDNASYYYNNELNKDLKEPIKSSANNALECNRALFLREKEVNETLLYKRDEINRKNREILTANSTYISANNELMNKKLNNQYYETLKLKDKYTKLKKQKEHQLELLEKKIPKHYIIDGQGSIMGFGKTSNENVYRIILVCDTYDNVVYFDYNDKDELIKLYDENNYILFKYRNSLLSSITDERGRLYRYEYDSNDNLTKIIYPSKKYSEFFYSEGKLNLIKDDSGLGVLLSYLNDKVSNIKIISFNKEIKNGNIINLDSSDTQLVINGYYYTVCEDISILYKDHRATEVKNNITNEVINYVFDILGNVVSEYKNRFENGSIVGNVDVTSYNSSSNKKAFTIQSLQNTEELLKNIQYEQGKYLTVSEHYLGDGSVCSDDLFLTSYLIENPNDSMNTVYEINSVVNPISKLEKKLDITSLLDENNKLKYTDLILSGWAKADSSYVDRRATDYSSYNEVNNELDHCEMNTILKESMDSYKENRRFELRAEIKYLNNGVSRVVYQYCSFDWMNTNWQYCAFPITFSEDEEDTLEEVKLVFDYSNNTNIVKFFGMSLKEGSWEYNEFDDSKVIYLESSNSEYYATYRYNDDKLLENVSLVNKTNALEKYETNYEYKDKYLIRVIDYNGLVKEYDYNNGKVISERTYHIEEPGISYKNNVEYDEKGKVNREYNAFGEKLYEYKYLNNSSLIENISLDNNVKQGYGYDLYDDTLVTNVINNNENKRKYVSDLLISLYNENCSFDFDYDGVNRVKKVTLCNKVYLEKSYSDLYENKIQEDGSSKNVKVGESITTTLYVKEDGSVVEKYKVEINNEGNITKVYELVDNSEKLLLENIYDTYDNLISSKDYSLNKEIDYNYEIDNLGRICTLSYIKDNHNISISYDYDSYNNVVSKVIKKDDNIIDSNSIEYGSSIDKKIEKVILGNGTCQTINYDKLGRVNKVVNTSNEGLVLTKKYNYLQRGTSTSNIINREIYGINNVVDTIIDYVYDKYGNIIEIRENDVEIVKYEYDEVQRIKREDNKKLNKTYTYSYDNNGNITYKREYGYKKVEELVKEDRYGYMIEGYRDKLISYNNDLIEYDNLGNIIKYKNNALKWERGKLLSKYGNDIEYKYNASGIRVSKKVGEVKTDYYLEGDKIIMQDNGNTMVFHYDAEGITGFTYNGTEEYYYKKNIQGDIVSIFDKNRQEIAKYVYDAWGNHKIYVLNDTIYVDIEENISYTNSGVNNKFIAITNPYRYRGYYYDEETELYYLKTRYYDPKVGRFISLDNIEYLNFNSINGLNLYAYCNNNPVGMCDPTGNSWKSFWNGIGTWFSDHWLKLAIGAGVVIAGAIVTAATCGTGLGFFAAFGGALLTSAKAVAISTAISAGIGLAIGGITTSSWKGALDGMLDGIADGFMWGGIFAGGAQILSGVFKAYVQVANHYNKLAEVKKSPFFSPDRLKSATEIAKIAKKGQSFYDYGGTIVRLGKFAHIDVSTKSLLHLAALGFNHIPIGTIAAGFIGGF